VNESDRVELRRSSSLCPQSTEIARPDVTRGCVRRVPRWSRSFSIPPLQTLGDVFALAMKGDDVENLLRARGEYRPHPVRAPRC
jgi:hypothetical protein